MVTQPYKTCKGAQNIAYIRYMVRYYKIME
jgi:hypothetical protein